MLVSLGVFMFGELEAVCTVLYVGLFFSLFWVVHFSILCFNFFSLFFEPHVTNSKEES